MPSTMRGELSDRVACLGCSGQTLPDHLVASVNEIVSLPGVDRALLLPDAHLKQKYVRAEYKASVPSSAVIVSEPDFLFPQFRSRGIGCGMMLVGTGIVPSRLPGGSKRLLNRLARYLANDNALPGKSFAMSPEDQLRMGTFGASWVAKQFGFPDEALRGFFRGGSFLSELEIGALSWDDCAPRWIEGRVRDGRGLGLDLGGNHFLEAQVVQDVPAAEPTLLSEGELVFLYHGSCNGLAAFLRPDLVRHLVERPDYTAFSPRDPEYDTVLRAVKVLLNWAAAARCLVLARLRSLLTTCFPGSSLEGLRCVSEAPHNTILAEPVDGAQKLVYRHNAVPIEAGRPAIVSGRHDHVSYLFLPGSAPENSLNTMDHGLGDILSRGGFEADSATPLLSRRIERQYVRGRSLWSRRRHSPLIDPTTTEPLFREPYERADVIESGCCRLRPMATLKRRTIPLRTLPPFKWIRRG